MNNRVFICHSSKDKDFVCALAANLKSQGVPVWLSYWDIKEGDDWDMAIDKALDQCDRFIIVLSPESVKSREVRGEMFTFLEKNSVDPLPVLYKPCDKPRQLRTIQHVDFTSGDPNNKEALAGLLRGLGVQYVPQKPLQKKPVSAPAPAPAPPPKPVRRKETGERKIGRVVRYYDRLGVAGIELTDSLRVGDYIRIRGRYTDFQQSAESIQRNYKQVNKADPGDSIGLLIDKVVYSGDEVYIVPVPSWGKKPGKTQPPKRQTQKPQRKETLIGTVINYYDRLGVVAIELINSLSSGDFIRIRGPHTDFFQEAYSIEINRRQVKHARPGNLIGLLVEQVAHIGDNVYKIQ